MNVRKSKVIYQVMKEDHSDDVLSVIPQYSRPIIFGRPSGQACSTTSASSPCVCLSVAWS